MKLKPWGDRAILRYPEAEEKHSCALQAEIVKLRKKILIKIQPDVNKFKVKYRCCGETL